MNSSWLTVSGFLGELVVISAVAMVCKSARLPYTLALVGVGLALGLLRPPLLGEVHLTPELLLTVLLPALLFESAMRLELRRLLMNFRPILLLAVPGVIISAGAVAICLCGLLGMSLQTALVFGALISATDPVSVLATFRYTGAPRQLSAVVQGESLFNDGTAVVLFQVLAAGLGVAASSGLFLRYSFGGILVGACLGWLVWRVTELIDDHLVEVTLSTILAYGSYLIGDYLKVSGVVAVIVAGIVYGSYSVDKMSVSTRHSLLHTWNYLGFLCNSLVFLLIGTQVPMIGLVSLLGPICLTFLSVCLGRVVAVVVLSPWLGLPRSYYPVVCWAGLRGSIPIALAMSLTLPERGQLLLLCFGVVLLSIFCQGLSLSALLRHMGLSRLQTDIQLEHETRLGQLLAQQSALEALDQMRREAYLHPQVYDEFARRLIQDIGQLQEELPNFRTAEVVEEERQELLSLLGAEQKKALREALSRGFISEDAYKTSLQRVESWVRVSPLEPEDGEE